MKRENGFYWVKNVFGKWVIMEFTGLTWFKCGEENHYSESKLIEINETKLNPPE